MSEAYDWSWLRNRMPVVDLSAYVSMPEDVASLIEVRDGMILHCESPSPNQSGDLRQFHVRAARRYRQQGFRGAVPAGQRGA